MVAIMGVILTVEKVELHDNFKGNLNDDEEDLGA